MVSHADARIQKRWPIYAEQILMRMWADGHSAREVKEALYEKFHFDVTRNSIIGKAHALGLKHPHGSGRTGKTYLTSRNKLCGTKPPAPVTLPPPPRLSYDKRPLGADVVPREVISKRERYFMHFQCQGSSECKFSAVLPTNFCLRHLNTEYRTPCPNPHSLPQKFSPPPLA